MKAVRHLAPMLLAYVYSISSACAVEYPCFFRVQSPVTSTVTRLTAGGSMSWSNSSAGITSHIQRTSSINSSNNWVDYIAVPATNVLMSAQLFDPSPPAGMVLVPGGTFNMGDALNDPPPGYGDTYERPVHPVFVSAFYIDQYEVTKAKWDSVISWATNHGYNIDEFGLPTEPDHPWIPTTWYEATKWCNARSEMEGLTPCYYVNSAHTTVLRYTEESYDLENSWVDWSANGYRLPTEAEWEKAARGGADGCRFPWGNKISHTLANYFASGFTNYDNSADEGCHPLFDCETAPVGTFEPNAYGIFDMAGNASEFCWDAYSTNYYTVSPAIDPRGPDDTGYCWRVERGGNCGNSAYNCRTSTRDYLQPEWGGPAIRAVRRFQ